MSGLVLWVCCSLFAVWLWLRPRHKSPPLYPGALPLIGHAHQVIGDRKHLWKFLQKAFTYCLEKGGVIELWTVNHSFYILTDPDDSLSLVNACLGKAYFYDFAKDFLKDGLITADASKWKVHRKLLNPAFNQQVLNAFVSEINVQSRNLVSQLNSEVGKHSFDVRPYFVGFTLKTVSRTSLGLDAQDQTMIDIDYAEAFENLLAVLIERGQKVWLHLSYLYNRSALKCKQDELIKKLRNIIIPVIEKRKSDLKENKVMSNESLPGNFKTVLDQMLYLADEQDAFTNDEIREHLDSFVAASYDTSSSAMTYVLLVIGSNKEVQDRIYNEIQEVLKDKDEDFTKHDLLKLVYLEAVIKETLRIYSPIPFVGRKVDVDVKLKNYTLRAGNTCLISLYGLNRHPMWGADAHQFKPERWLNPATLPDNPNVHASFSIGKRNCIGKLYGMMVMKTTLAHILRRYYVSSDISNLESEFDIVLKPVEGHLLSLTLRK